VIAETAKPSTSNTPMSGDVVYSEEYQKAYTDSMVAFNKNDFVAAVSFLDEAEKIQPRTPMGLNLRGAIFIRLQKLEEAEVIFRELILLNPQDPIPVFNLGETFFMQKKYAEAKKQFQQFLGMGRNSDNALGLFKLFLTDLLLGNKAETQKVIDNLRPSPQSPFYYFANAAVSFKQGNEQDGRSWVDSARAIYIAGMNAAFADSFVVLGWFTREEIGDIGLVSETNFKSLSNPINQNDGKDLGPGAGISALQSLIPDLTSSKDKNKEKEKEKK